MSAVMELESFQLHLIESRKMN